MFILEVQNTAFKGKQFKFKDGMTVGRLASCKIRAEHDEMQDVHARFYADGERAMVEIACKDAHLFVNGKDVVRSELRHNDELTVGPLKFRVFRTSQISSSSLRLDQLIEELEKNGPTEVFDFARDDLFFLTTRDPILRQNIAFTIPSRDRFIEQAQVFLTRLVKGSGMAEEQVDAFMTCAKELILNAHRHGHKYDESKKISIHYHDLDDRVGLVITDEGTGFDHETILSSIRNKDAAQAARERYLAGGVGGLGFKLVTQICKDLAYNELGNQVSFSIPKKSA
jgi:anti-sigma regulatory factor (Ser/Thr protein kinase)